MNRNERQSFIRKKLFSILLALMLVLGLMPAEVAHAEGNVYSITGIYITKDGGSGFATFTVGETCPVCDIGTLEGRFHDAIGSARAYHSIRCNYPGCEADMDEDCTGDATCTHSGTCTVCGNTYYEYHEYRVCYPREATCTEIGYKYQCWYCTKCQLYYVRDQLVTDVVIPALGHDIVPHEAKAPTCTEPGWGAYDTCSRCDYSTYVEIPAKGHTEVVDPAVEPTCTEPGKTEGKHCSVCGDVLVAQEEIPAKGHTEVVDPAVEPTCTEPGKTEGKYCSVCGEVLVAQETMEALGHDWDEWKVTTEPAIGKAGERQRTCKRCGETEKESIAALIGYTVTEGAGGSWTKGSGASFTITVKRSEDDANCFNHYTETLIDGKVVSVSAKSGSTVITISADTLEKLSTGTHTVTVKFDDGQVETQLTVKAASSPTQPETPVTGDNSHMGLWIALMCVSGMALAGLLIATKKKKARS